MYKPQCLQQQHSLFVGLCKQEVSVNAGTVSQTAFSMLSDESHVEAFSLAG